MGQQVLVAKLLVSWKLGSGGASSWDKKGSVLEAREPEAGFPKEGELRNKQRVCTLQELIFGYSMSPYLRGMCMRETIS